MTSGLRPGEGKDVSALLGVLRRRGWIVLVCVVVAGGAAYLYTDRQPRTYEASATLLLRSPGGNASNGVYGIAIPSTAPDREQLVLSQSVEDRAIKILSPVLGGRAAASEAVAKVVAHSAAESSAVRITASASTPAMAASIANIIAEQNVAYRRASTLNKIGRAQRVARKELARLTSTPSDAPKLAVINQVRLNLQALGQLAGVQDGDADILQRASPAGAKLAPNPRRAAVMGGFAGLLLGFALALVREQLDRRLRRAQELGDTFDLPILANVPRSRSLANKEGQGVNRCRPQSARPSRCCAPTCAS